MLTVLFWLAGFVAITISVVGALKSGVTDPALKIPRPDAPGVFWLIVGGEMLCAVIAFTALLVALGRYLRSG
jgi:hypothetical protein